MKVIIKKIGYGNYQPNDKKEPIEVTDKEGAILLQCGVAILCDEEIEIVAGDGDETIIEDEPIVDGDEGDETIVEDDENHTDDLLFESDED